MYAKERKLVTMRGGTPNYYNFYFQRIDLKNMITLL